MQKNGVGIEFIDVLCDVESAPCLYFGVQFVDACERLLGFVRLYTDAVKVDGDDAGERVFGDFYLVDLQSDVLFFLNFINLFFNVRFGDYGNQEVEDGS